ncbi:MAG: hypothetical protein JW873_00680 [Candidatus Saganbacteria bacterium]|nr:hypothetical protein [Candidatus Saganbacteria bacterium]
MGWLVFVVAISLLAGCALLFADERIEQAVGWFNRQVFHLDPKLYAVRVPAGLALIIAGGWLFSVARAFASLWYLGVSGAVVIAIGALYVFLPDWLGGLTSAADQLLISTDELILNARKNMGVALIVSALYMFIVLVAA